jgi:2-dehydropantoate 2-reductase
MVRPVRVTVLGTGAMACFFGARLAQAGLARVTLAGTWPAARAALARDGVRVLADDGAWSVPVAVVDRAGPLAPADLVLVLVKSHQTAAVAPHAARARAPSGLVLTLQNGLGQREVLAAVVGAAHVAVGVTAVGATLVAPGIVRPAGMGGTVLGRTADTADRVGLAAELFTAAGLPATVTDAIERLLWRKLAVNAAINALTALAGVPNGALLADPRWAADLDAAAREVGAVAAAAGIDLGADPAELAREVARATATNRSSMLQDLDRGAPTEVDAIQGAVVRTGRRLGVPTPVNEWLWRAVRARESGAVAG